MQDDLLRSKSTGLISAANKKLGNVTTRDIEECGIVEDGMSEASINSFAEVAWVDPFPLESNGVKRKNKPNLTKLLTKSNKNTSKPSKGPKQDKKDGAKALGLAFV